MIHGLQARKGDSALSTDANRTLRTTLAAVAALLFIPNLALADQVYTVRSGDTLYAIAQRYHTTVSEIAKANGIDSRKPIRSDQELRIPSDLPPMGTTAVVTRDHVQVRANGTRLVATLSKGSEVRFLEKKDGQYAVKLSNGLMGRVPVDSIEFVPGESQAETTVDRQAFGREIARTAYAYRGSRYRRGGMSSRGFDCSGFVKYVYERQGVKLPRTSYDMFKVGTTVAKNDLKEGDLVFFANTYRRGISHVGMYVGDGEFIHASTTRGGVRVDRLDDAYYRGRYAGARRIKDDE